MIDDSDARHKNQILGKNSPYRYLHVVIAHGNSILQLLTSQARKTRLFKIVQSAQDKDNVGTERNINTLSSFSMRPKFRIYIYVIVCIFRSKLIRVLSFGLILVTTVNFASLAR